MLNVNQLQYFVVSAEQGSLSKAAEVLYTSQPYVSKMIKSLESYLGMELFERTPRGVALSKDGERIYAYAKNILKNVELINYSKKNKGESLFSIATNPSSKMSELFSNFYNDKKFENIKFKYIEGGVEKIINAVDNEEVQIGFVFVPKNKTKAFKQLLERKNLQFVLLAKTDIILSAGKNSPIYNSEYVEIDQLKHLKFIQLEEDYFTLNDILSSSISSEKNNTYLDYQVITNSDHAMIKLLNSSDLCNIGGCWFKGSYKNEEIRMIPIRGYEKYLNFGYIKHKNRYLNKEGEEFVSYIMNIVKDNI